MKRFGKFPRNEKLYLPAQDISDYFIMGRELGRGQYGIVYEVTDKATGEKFACKQVSLLAALNARRALGPTSGPVFWPRPATTLREATPWPGKPLTGRPLACLLDHDRLQRTA